jgi:hypothetical protein
MLLHFLHSLHPCNLAVAEYTKKIMALSCLIDNVMSSLLNIFKHLNCKAFVYFVSFVVKYSG